MAHWRLVDESMPVVVIAPHDTLLEKVKSNMQEVRARGGELFVFADLDSHFTESEGVHVIRTPRYAGISVTDRAYHPGAVAVLSHRAGQRHGRGQAAQSGQERNGGVSQVLAVAYCASAPAAPPRLLDS
jgi:glucosamine 6-phosphate synthetase-like amidotransferase/phosphosugar isomerase protein